eukprot:350272-Chlamydomonas_euryale.AAC.9
MRLRPLRLLRAAGQGAWIDRLARTHCRPIPAASVTQQLRRRRRQRQRRLPPHDAASFRNRGRLRAVQGSQGGQAQRGRCKQPLEPGVRAGGDGGGSSLPRTGSQSGRGGDAAWRPPATPISGVHRSPVQMRPRRLSAVCAAASRAEGGGRVGCTADAAAAREQSCGQDEGGGGEWKGGWGRRQGCVAALAPFLGRECSRRKTRFTGRVRWGHRRRGACGCCCSGGGGGGGAATRGARRGDRQMQSACDDHLTTRRDLCGDARVSLIRVSRCVAGRQERPGAPRALFEEIAVGAAVAASRACAHGQTSLLLPTC